VKRILISTVGNPAVVHQAKRSGNNHELLASSSSAFTLLKQRVTLPFFHQQTLFRYCKQPKKKKAEQRSRGCLRRCEVHGALTWRRKGKITKKKKEGTREVPQKVVSEPEEGDQSPTKGEYSPDPKPPGCYPTNENVFLFSFFCLFHMPALSSSSL
jgi:hypothetical protein